MSNHILELNNVTKNFPGVKALDNANFKLKKGSIHALLGENGAGKSTMIKIKKVSHHQMRQINLGYQLFIKKEI